jgi:hypothetical protein
MAAKPDIADRHIHDPHRSEWIGAFFQTGLSAAALDQQELVQPCMAVRFELPIMQDGARSDGLAMHDVRQVAGLAE